MPHGKGTYGKKVGRPPQQKKKMMGGGIVKKQPIKKMNKGGMSKRGR